MAGSRDLGDDRTELLAAAGLPPDRLPAPAHPPGVRGSDHEPQEAVPAISRDEGLSIRKRGDRKRAMGTRSPMMLPEGPNERWSLDFVSDALNNGRRVRVLTMVDD